MTLYFVSGMYLYLGCYQDGGDRDLPTLLSGIIYTPPTCFHACQGSKYFALQYMGVCICGDSAGKHGRTNESKCSMACNTDTTYMCGASYINSVYMYIIPPTGKVKFTDMLHSGEYHSKLQYFKQD